MTQTLVARGVAFSVAVLAGGMLAATPVQASAPVPVPGKPYGTVSSTTGLNERAYPSTDSAVRSTLARGTKTALRCKVRAQEVGGNNVWYQLKDRPTWVHASFVTSNGAVPLCRDINRTALDDSPTVRAAMG
ncbi:SH3 domain-containing protein [Streptomyces olivoreticuli]|nr:SH3 domain-containing protein [Streptomyces olivoreticuli]WKK23447.1 SH3 domain-containing protein [Streptomyces olivoreticuli]